MKKEIEEKRANEKKVVEQMIKLYCRKNHQKKELCTQCQTLLDYANKRIDRCPFMEEKTFCSNCQVHCYKPEERKKICTVMRFSGPRMIFYHPIMAIKHLILMKKEQKKLEK